jgi:hypothetical protein
MGCGSANTGLLASLGAAELPNTGSDPADPAGLLPCFLARTEDFAVAIEIPPVHRTVQTMRIYKDPNKMSNKYTVSAASFPFH